MGSLVNAQGKKQNDKLDENAGNINSAKYFQAMDSRRARVKNLNYITVPAPWSTGGAGRLPSAAAFPGFALAWARFKC